MVRRVQYTLGVQYFKAIYLLKYNTIVQKLNLKACLQVRKSKTLKKEQYKYKQQSKITSKSTAKGQQYVFRT